MPVKPNFNNTPVKPQPQQNTVVKPHPIKPQVQSNVVKPQQKNTSVQIDTNVSVKPANTKVQKPSNIKVKKKSKKPIIAICIVVPLILVAVFIFLKKDTPKTFISKDDYKQVEQIVWSNYNQYFFCTEKVFKSNFEDLLFKYDYDIAGALNYVFYSYGKNEDMSYLGIGNITHTTPKDITDKKVNDLAPKVQEIMQNIIPYTGDNYEENI